MPTRSICAFLFVSLPFSMTACAWIQQPDNPEDTGLGLQTTEFDGLERSYYLHMPPEYNAASRLPVVFVLHGGGKAGGDEVASRTGADHRDA